MNFRNKKACTNIAALTIKKTFGISFLILDPPHQLVVTLLMGTVILLLLKSIYLFNCIRSSWWLAVSSFLCIGVSLVVVQGLSCPVASGLLVPSWGIEPTSPALEGRFLTTGPTREVPDLDWHFFVALKKPLVCLWPQIVSSHGKQMTGHENILDVWQL